MLDDTTLISRLQSGDEQAYRFLFDHEYEPMCRFANQMLHDRMEAESVVGDVIFNIWVNRQSLQISSSLHSYLFAAVRNRCLNALKSRLRILSLQNYEMNLEQEIELVDIIFSDDRQPLGILIEKELEEQIQKAIEQLPPECRTVFCKSRMEGMAYGEIASNLGISVNTVKYHIRNAISRLRANLDGYLRWIIIAMLIQ